MFLLDAATAKPRLDININGPDGNIFTMVDIVGKAWLEQGRADIASELRQRVFQCHSYDGPDGSLALVKSYYTEEKQRRTNS